MILDFNTTGLRLSIPTPYPHLNFHNLLVCLGNMFSHCSLMDYLTSVGNKLFHIFIYLFWFVSCASYEDYTLDIFKSIKNKGILYRFSNKYQEVLEKTIFSTFILTFFIGSISEYPFNTGNDSSPLISFLIGIV